MNQYIVSIPGYDIPGVCTRCGGPVVMPEGTEPEHPLYCLMCQLQDETDVMGLGDDPPKGDCE